MQLAREEWDLVFTGLDLLIADRSERLLDDALNQETEARLRAERDQARALIRRLSKEENR